MILPQLRVFMLREAPLLSRTSSVHYIDELIGWLTLRCNHGQPIQQLYLVQCLNTTAADVRRLEEVVPEVHWDGIEEYESNDDMDED